MERVRGWLQAAGRDPKQFGIEQRINTSAGGPDDWRRIADEWRAFGATHLSINTMNAGLRGPDAHVARLREARAALEAYATA
jgi:hypothetical protein